MFRALRKKRPARLSDLLSFCLLIFSENGLHDEADDVEVILNMLRRCHVFGSKLASVQFWFDCLLCFGFHPAV